jgi:two-component system, OmpR family, phosphate regulon sensor histidine kinase PhoR
MSRKRIWLYATILFVVTGTILVTQVLWIFQAARIEENFINHRVNQALCSAMDILSKDKGICSSVQTCVTRTQGSFELTLGNQEKSKIDSVIREQLTHYNLSVPFQTSFAQYTSKEKKLLSPNQALLYPVSNAGIQNVLVNVQIPSKNDLVRAQINGTFILSMIMLIVLTVIFTIVLRALSKEYTIRKETVDLVNTMAHDLKTPISNISLALTMIEKENKNLNGSLPYISIINTETTKLKQRAKQILGIATVDAMLTEVSEKTEVNVHELIHQCIPSFSLRLKNLNGNIQMKLDATAAFVSGNKVQLSTALTNLIDNAIAYSERTPAIKVFTENFNGGIAVSIIDNGTGISENQQKLIFKKGYRVHNGHSPVEGFGMGLYLAKSLIEKQDGKLTLQTSDTNGSNFVIWLPIKS